MLGLSGELGAGKTHFVKGLARGLGFGGRVHSPTFALVNIYTGGRLTLYHLDLYRLETPQQIVAAGLEEYLQPAGVTVIEWAERWFREPNIGHENDPPSDMDAPSRLRWVRFDTMSETERRISYDAPGA